MWRKIFKIYALLILIFKHWILSVRQQANKSLNTCTLAFQAQIIKTFQIILGLIKKLWVNLLFILYNSILLRMLFFFLFYIVFFCLISPSVVFAAEPTVGGSVPYPAVKPQYPGVIAGILDCISRGEFEVSVHYSYKPIGPKIPNISPCNSCNFGFSFYQKKLVLFPIKPFIQVIQENNRTQFLEQLLSLTSNHPKLTAKATDDFLSFAHSHPKMTAQDLVSTPKYDPFHTLLGKKVRNMCPQFLDPVYSDDILLSYMSRVGHYLDLTHNSVYAHAGAQLITVAEIIATSPTNNTDLINLMASYPGKYNETYIKLLAATIHENANTINEQQQQHET